MKKLAETEAVKAAILGTFVADASGLGVHWIYSQGKIAQIAKAHEGEVEFLDPEAGNYEGAPSFFAHPHRRAGDSSNYGEYLYVLLRSISDDGFDVGSYVRIFQEYFGVGGEYVGYADTPMRETIFNVARLGKDVYRRALSAESSLDEKKQRFAAHYISHYFFESDTEGLRRQVRTPLKLQQWKREELEEADRLVELVKTDLGAIGPEDDQMPALSRSAVLAWFYQGDELDQVVERAVRITNNDDDAVAYSRFFARMMRDIYQEGPRQPAEVEGVLRRLTEKYLSILSEPSRELVRKALEYPELDYRRATKTFGAACHVHMAVPLTLHILLKTSSFAEAVRINNRSSGDNCGRAVMLGALAGALYGTGGVAGIPRLWIDRTATIRRARATEGGALLLG
ncbi:MAG: ADP-ribosylglycohydrolase family protein, partial [Spirochaetaceae bacterium]